VAVNLKDCAPFASQADASLPAADRSACDGLSREGAEADRKGNFTTAADRWARAAALDAHSAELQFELGSCLLALTNFASARQHLEQARDFDALPFRGRLADQPGYPGNRPGRQGRPRDALRRGRAV